MKREFELSDRFVRKISNRISILCYKICFDFQSSHAVVQFQLLNWPDHGVPISTSTFLRFYKACISAQGSSTEPMIVHCRYMLHLNIFTIDLTLN